MGLIREIAKFARLGDVERINHLLDESPDWNEEIRLGRRAADRILHPDRLPELGEGQMAMITREQGYCPTYRSQRKGSRKRAA